jgi:hypothetical protein
MNIEQGSEITSTELDNYYTEIDNLCSNLNSLTYSAYSKSNMLYNQSSVLDDILTSNMASLYSKLNSIVFSYTNDKVSFLESFESLEYIDKEFNVDSALNIDTSNRSLSLPIKKSTTVDVISVIIEADSNGSAGNSLNGYTNVDIKSIFDGNIASVFEYEKYTSIFDAGNLTLALTLKLIKFTAVNTIYVKMYNDSAIKYPTLELIEVSNDGVEWKPVNGFISTFTDQNDFYIRFEAVHARYIRVKLMQQIAQQVQTGFGLKNRYSIGLRDIQVITNEYNDRGSYVSIPFSTGKQISNIKLTSEYITSSGISFYVSANNGGYWIPLTNGEELSLININTGVILAENIKSLRVKIDMKRAYSSDTLKQISQLVQYSSSGTYQLSYNPIELTASIGGHISCGGDIRYVIQAPYPYNILDELYKNSGIRLTQGLSSKVYFGEREDTLLSSSTSAGSLTLLRKLITENTNSLFTFTVKYIPYYEDIENDLSLFLGNQEIPCFLNDNGQNKVLWIATKDYNTCHTIIYVDLVNLELMYKSGTNTIINGNINSGINLQFKKVIHDPTVVDYGNLITLKHEVLNNGETDITITEYKNGSFARQLRSSEFTLYKPAKNMIVINEGSFSDKSIYYVSYTPRFDISHLLDTNNISSPTIELKQLIDAPYSAMVSFNYKYEDLALIMDTKYFSPLCKNYKIELS